MTLIARAWTAVATALAIITSARPTVAHSGAPPTPDDLWTAWSWDPAVVAGLAVGAALYARGMRTYWGRVGSGRGVRPWRVAAYATGLATISVALVSPLDALATALFAAHMVQHLLLVLVAAPLLVLGLPLIPFLWGCSRRRRHAIGRWWHRAALVRAAWRALRQPVVAWLLAAATLWVWHLPGLYQAALASAPLHALEHVTLLATALLFWWVALYPGWAGALGYAGGALYVFTSGLHSSLLGVVITFARAPWYPAYGPSAAAWGLTPLEDQQLAGLLMWVPAGLLYAGVAIALLVAGLRADERAARRRERLAET